MLHSLVNVDGKDFLVDKTSGEVLAEAPKDGRAIWVKTKRLRDKSFVILMDMDLEKLASLKLSPTSWRLFYLLLQHTEFENWVYLNQAEMARMLKVSRQQVYASSSQLVKVGIIRREEDKNKIFRWRVDPAIAWRGSLDDQLKSLSAFEPKTLNEYHGTEITLRKHPSSSFDGKCVCGSTIKGQDQDELNEWMATHRDCEIEIEEWQTDLDESQSRS